MTRSITALFFGAMILGGSTLTADEKPKDKSAAKVEFRRAEKEAAEGLREATVEGTKEKVYLHKTADLTNEDIAEVKATEDDRKQPMISITLTKDGAAKMKKVTEEHRDKLLAILVDGKVISAPVIKSAIAEGKVQITGKFTKEEVDKLVKQIQGK
jgi:preprotein translocase subunit SecD